MLCHAHRRSHSRDKCASTLVSLWICRGRRCGRTGHPAYACAAGGRSYPFLDIILRGFIDGSICGPGPALLATLLGALAVDYLFMNPRGTFLFSGLAQYVDVIICVGVCVGIAIFIEAAKKRAAASVERLKRAQQALAHSEERIRLTV